MALALTQREKKLLFACIGALVLVGTMFAASEFMDRQAAVQQDITALQRELEENKGWYNDREFWEKRSKWLRDTMPETESLGQAQAILLEDVENDALDWQFVIDSGRKTLLDPVSNENYREVAIEVRLRGDQIDILSWLAGLQSPERFQAIKELEIELDTRSKEKTPQAMCNLTLARWFKPETGL
jgi:Tfp pilus assembly protein PilO